MIKSVYEERNIAMMMDLYELTMANGYFVTGNKDKVAVFDMFYRKNPDGGGFVVSAGLGMLIDYIKGLHFTEDDTIVSQIAKGNVLFETGLREIVNW